MCVEILNYLILKIRYLVIGLIALGPQGLVSAEIPQYYKEIAQYWQVPVDIFYAIALQESQRKINGVIRPYPWTLNICGKGSYYQTQHEAEKALQSAIKKNCSVDVGLYQIHWQSHKKHFKSYSHALEPIYNMQVGAYILSEQYKITKNWYLAVGRYHSPNNKALAKIYRSKVYKRLRR